MSQMRTHIKAGLLIPCGHRGVIKIGLLGHENNGN